MLPNNLIIPSHITHINDFAIMLRELPDDFTIPNTIISLGYFGGYLHSVRDGFVIAGYFRVFGRSFKNIERPRWKFGRSQRWDESKGT